MEDRNITALFQFLFDFKASWCGNILKVDSSKGSGQEAYCFNELINIFTADARASDVNDEMKVAAAYAIAGLGSDEELTAEYILPAAFDPRVKDAVAKAVEEAERKSGVARI